MSGPSPGGPEVGQWGLVVARDRRGGGVAVCVVRGVSNGNGGHQDRRDGTIHYIY